MGRMLALLGSGWELQDLTGGRCWRGVHGARAGCRVEGELTGCLVGAGREQQELRRAGGMGLACALQ